MGVLTNLDLLSVGIVVAATGVLGFTIYFQDRTSVTSRAFLFFSIITAFWGGLTYLEYHVAPEASIWVLRLSLFFAAWQAYFLFRFLSTFPEREYAFRRTHTFVLIPVVATTSFLTLTPFVLDHIIALNSDGTISAIANGPAIPIFGLVSVALVVRGLWVFLRKGFTATGANRRPYLEILLGTFITFALIITFNFILPAFFNISRFVALGSVFMFPFVAFAAYAILREHLFNIKVLATSTLVFILSIVSFGEIIFSNTLSLILFRTSVFVLVLVFGINLIRGVIREVEQREQIQKLAGELSETNERQKGLIRFISHEVKGFLTKDTNVFAALVEGDFGILPETMKPIVSQALAQSRDGVRSAEDILKASNQKNGTTTYKKEPFDLKALATETLEKSRLLAEGKGLKLSFVVDDASAPYTILGDRAEIGDHVLRNLIDNSISYTPAGSIAVSLKKQSNKIIFSVQDTGIGITEEDKKRLFTEGGHGKDSQKVNVHSTGYGLFIAKQIIEAHGGAVRAESEGQGKGSLFVVELPPGKPS